MHPTKSLGLTYPTICHAPGTTDSDKTARHVGPSAEIGNCCSLHAVSNMSAIRPCGSPVSTTSYQPKESRLRHSFFQSSIGIRLSRTSSSEDELTNNEGHCPVAERRGKLR